MNSVSPGTGIEDDGIRARVIAGSTFGRKSPVGTLSEWLYAEVSLAAGASAPLDPDQEERAIYLVEGELDIAAGSLLILSKALRGVGVADLRHVQFSRFRRDAGQSAWPSGTAPPRFADCASGFAQWRPLDLAWIARA
jgi:hypothetical protein